LFPPSHFFFPSLAVLFSPLIHEGRNDWTAHESGLLTVRNVRSLLPVPWLSLLQVRVWDGTVEASSSSKQAKRLDRMLRGDWLVGGVFCWEIWESWKGESVLTARYP
jgi:hypothetical protein